MLSERQQLARIRQLAGRALGAYPLADPQLRLIAHQENTTFRVDATAAGGRRDRFLLRVHRPARHGRQVDPVAAIRSELDWLMALRADTGLPVPEPVRTTDGSLTTTAASRDVPEPRVCSVLRWMDGRIHAASPRPVHLRRLGSVMARLHNHAAQWDVPPGFVRIRWDAETFFGDTMVYGGISAAAVWDLLPAALRRRFGQVATRMERVMTRLGDDGGQAGLIHADLHLGNALFWRDEVRVIDFDDCGFGYWLYDIAVALWELRDRDDYAQFLAALIEGYTRHRPLPPGGLAHLDDFIATRDVAFALWFTGTAQVNPAFRADLEEVLENTGRSLEALSGD
jgi:Ser/Thr protein kinase RdoA (MazF antagonist)